MPRSREKARANADSLSYPTRAAMVFTGASHREYWNVAAANESFGGLSQVASAMGAK